MLRVLFSCEKKSNQPKEIHMKKFAVVLALVIPALVLGAAAASFDPIAQFRPVVAIKGFFVGPIKGKNSVVRDVGNGLTAIRVSTVDYDIPVIPPDGAQGGTFVSADISIDAGILANDRCSVVALARYDGGVHPQLNFTCYAKAYNTVVLVGVNNVQDGGAHNPPDSGYEFWTTSHLTQPAQ